MIIQSARQVIIPSGFLSVHRPRSAAVAGNGLLNSLIAYWPGNEASGNALDLHTNALTLTDINTVTSNPGLAYALARQYTAANIEYHTRASEALLLTGNIDFTFAAWCYLDTEPADGYLVCKRENYGMDYVGGVTRCFRFWMYSGAFILVRANTFGAASTGTWCLVTGWHDSVADTVNIAINNGAVDSLATGGAVPGTAANALVFGAWVEGVAHFNGRIGPTMFWKSAAGAGGVLDAAKRTALFNAGAGLPYAGFTL